MKYSNSFESRKIKEGEIIKRAFVCEQVKSINNDKRQIDFVISTDRIDRYGDSILVNGWQLKEYRKNPIVLFGHNSRVPPIGKAVKVWKDETLNATAEFMSEELSAFANSIYRMYQEKFLKAVSVGFAPLKYEEIKDDKGNWTGGYLFQQQELLEFSCVPIPANPDAMLDARQKGIDTQPFKDWAEQQLDSWGTEGDVLKTLYGVGRREIENIQRKAAGVGARFVVPAEVQDELLRKNLEAAKKAKEGNGGIEVKETLTIELDFIKLELPKCAPTDFDDLGALSLDRVNDGKGEKIIFDEFPETTGFGIDFLKEEFAKDEPRFSLEGDMLKIMASDRNAYYKLVGADEACLYGTLMSVKDSENEETNEEVKDQVEEQAANSESSAPQDKSGEEVEKAIVDVTIEVPDESTKLNREQLIKKLAEHFKQVEAGEQTGWGKELDDEPLSFGLQLHLLEKSLGDFEDSLDIETKNGYPSRHAAKKLEFLAGWLRELADKLAPEKEKQVEQPGENGLTVEEFNKEVADRIASLGPVITEIVAKELRIAKGRLD